MILLNPKVLASWFSMVRDAPPEHRDRVLECFWDTQLEAKQWLNNKLIEYCLNHDENRVHLPPVNTVYIFGGWYGVLASMLHSYFDLMIEHIYSIDLDPECERYGASLQNDRINFVTANMAEYEYPWEHTPTLVINTSSEHVEQGIYDQWYDKIPHGTIVVVQGNNFFSCREHVRCAKNLEEFKVLNHVIDPLYVGELPNPQYTRYMAIWKK